MNPRQRKRFRISRGHEFTISINNRSIELGRFRALKDFDFYEALGTGRATLPKKLIEAGYIEEAEQPNYWPTLTLNIDVAATTL